ncbi:hypothetical protein HY419_01905 [candidate division WWE3 bacterium]|nr:hypothetical protein [candidate division WWE3 bacterium]
MNKIHKYFMNFNILLFLGILLALPFLPYIKLGGLPALKVWQADNQAVLSTSTKAESFSEVALTKVVDLTFPQNLYRLEVSKVATISNSLKKPARFKVVVEELSPGAFEANGAFESNESSAIFLLPDEKAEVSLTVKRSAKERVGRFVVVVLTSL